MSDDTRHLDRQRRFYASRRHDHLRPQSDDHYSTKLVARLAEAVGMQPHHRVVEIGASFGRFTIPLLSHCQSVVAVDVSERALDELAASRERLGIAESRCRVHVGDAREIALSDLGPPPDFVVGFFILHHLEDMPGTIAGLSRLIGPGGQLAFVEPNRRNPLFLAQVLGCKDMSWREERGMFRLSASGVRRAFQRAGLADDAVARFGFFPPQLLNRFEWSRRLEAGIERAQLFEPLLPFLLLSARVGRVADEKT